MPLTININLQLSAKRNRRKPTARDEGNDAPVPDLKSVANDEEEIDYILVEGDGNLQIIGDDDEFVFVEGD